MGLKERQSILFVEKETKIDQNRSVFLCDEIILVDASQTGIQWSSAEYLISYPTAYRYAIALNYNTACTPGAGSAIFLHCSTGGATAGCISVSLSDMICILKMLQDDTLIGIYQNKSSLY